MAANPLNVNQTFGQPQQVEEIPQRGVPGIPESLIDAIIHQESGGRASATGKAGEVGLMQITPGVAQRYGVSVGQLFDPTLNRQIGTRYLNDLLGEFHGNLPLALAAYNAGAGRVKNGSIPESTLQYVGKILNRMVGALGPANAYGGDDAWSHAKPIANPWESAKPIANPWASAKPAAGPAAATPPNGVEQFYEQNIRDPLRGALNYTPDVLKRNAFYEKYFDTPASKSVTNMLVPDSATSAAINTSMLIPGLGEAGLATRLAAPTLAGAATAEATGENPLAGAAEGLASQGAGELGGFALGAGGRLIGKKGLLGDTTASIGKQIGRALEIKTPNTGADLESLFTRGGAIDTVSQATAPVRQQLNNLAQGVSFNVPVMSRGGKINVQSMSLPKAEEALTKLGELGYTRGGDIRTMVASREARIAAYRTRGQIAAKLDQMMPGAGASWLAARRQLGSAQALKRLFDPANKLLDPHTGEIDAPNLIKAILENHDDLIRNLGPKGTEELLQIARRFDPRPVSDQPSVAPHIGLRIHGPHASIGRTYRPVGNVPGYMQGRTYRAPLAIAVRSWIDKMLQGGNDAAGQ